MALSAGLQFDVRTGGSDANGGAFDPTVASPGTDYSQQNSAQVAFTDLVIAATTTNVTSVANPFSAASVGNVINITAGTGFTPGRYTVVSFTLSGFVATLDRSAGTAASISGTGNLGGSLVTVQAALTAFTVAGQTINVKSGTYTQTTSLLAPNSFFTLIGYAATHGDGGTAPLITTATNSTELLHLQTAPGTATPCVILDNLTLSNTAGTPAAGIAPINRNIGNVVLRNCTMSGFTIGFALDNIGSHYELAAQATLEIINSTIQTCTTYGVSLAQGTCICRWSLFSGNTTAALWDTNSGSQPSFDVDFCIFSGNGIGIYEQNNSMGSVLVDHSIFFNQGTVGIRIPSGTITFGSSNSIYYSNGTYGIQCVSAGLPISISRANAYGANGTAPFLNFVAGAGDVTLTANPFVSSGTGNFALNSTGGGGAALRGAGYPGTSVVGAGFADIGVLQHQDSPSIAYVVNQIISRFAEQET